MRNSWFVLLLLTGMAFAQATQPKPGTTPMKPESEEAEEKEAAPPAVTVAPDATVMTIKGLCSDNATGDACKTVITRAEFDKLAEALQPGMPQPVRRQLANVMSRGMLMSREAEKRGLDKDPRFDQMMKFARLQIMTQEVTRSLQEEAAKISDADLDKYYKDNPAGYEEATLQRLYVPRMKQIDAPKDSKDKAAEDKYQADQKASQAAMDKLAESLRTRAAAGENFDKLQKEAFDAAGIKSNTPSTKMENVRRTGLPPAHVGVMENKAGEVSQVISDPSGHFIYKTISKSEMPFDKVKDEIKSTLQNQRMKDSMQKVQDSATTDLNEAYFGAAAPPPPPGHPGMPMRK